MFYHEKVVEILKNEIEKRSFLNNNYLKTTSYLWSVQDSFAGMYDKLNIEMIYTFQLKGIPEEYHYSFSIKPAKCYDILDQTHHLEIELQRSIIKSFGHFIGYLYDRFGVISIGVYKTAMNILENDPTVISDPYLDNLFEQFLNVDTTTFSIDEVLDILRFFNVIRVGSGVSDEKAARLMIKTFKREASNE